MSKKDERREAARILAKRGGETTLKKHGKGHYKMMAEKRWGSRRRP